MKHHEFSPSTLGRLALCPGSYQCSLGLPPEPDSEEAASGTRIHAAVAAGVLYEMSADEQEQVQRCFDYLQAVEGCLSRPYEAYREKVVQLSSYAYGIAHPRLLTEGTADVVVLLDDNTAIVIDWKTGHHEVSSAGAAFQLSVYAAALLQDRTELYQVRAVAYHCRTRTEFSRTIDRSEVASIIDAVSRVIAKAKGEDIILRPSYDACVGLYCPAIRRCPAAHRVAQNLPAIYKPGTPALPIGELARLADQAHVVERYVSMVKDELRRRLQGGEADPTGRWILQAVQGHREVFDPQGAWAICQRAGMALPDFMSAVKVAVGQLENKWVQAALQTEEGKTKKTVHLKQAFTSAFSDVIQRRPAYTKLHRTGGNHDRPTNATTSITAGSTSES